MKIRRALIALLCTAGLVACDGETTDDAGTDAGGVVLQDSGPGNDDGGGDDAGPGNTDGGGDDAGPGNTDGGDNDGGPGVPDGGDAGPPMGDAGCMVTACAATECGMRDDGCGTMIDCGACAVGAACAADADCASMNCLTETDTAWPAGYCTAECRYDTDCAAGTHCGYRNDVTLLGVCVADCMNDMDCRTSYSCRDADEAGTNECAPIASGMGTTGAACNSFADCAGGVDGICVPQGTGFFGGLCTSTCMIDGDCGAGNHCAFIPAGGGDGICAPNCTMDSDCRGGGTMGYGCHNADEDAGGVLECWAAGTGAGAPGAACVGLWECAGGGDAACQTEAGGALGGYCLTTDCTIGGTDCATGSHCVQFTGVTACLADCTADTDCRGMGTMGFACFNLDNDMPATTECWQAGTGTAAVGAACNGVYDCAGRERAACLQRPGNDFKDGYCTLLGCTNPPAVGSDCPVGAHCTIFTTMGLPNPTGLCTDDCATDADCRGAGYSCFDNGDVDMAPECWPGGTGTAVTGEACRWTEDCAGGPDAICLIDQITVTPPFRGGYCTDACTVAADCTGVGSVCQSGLCWDSCAAALDCRMMDMYTCMTPAFAGFTQNICWPQ